MIAVLNRFAGMKYPLYSGYMTDPVRSKIMRSIQSKNTRPEVKVRKTLHKLGFRFRIHSKRLPGKPDIVLPKYGAVILVNGCFWHGHDCHIFKLPRQDEWREKIQANTLRDKKNVERYQSLGWRVLIVWECALQGKEKLPIHDLEANLQNWILFDNQSAEIRGRARPRN